MDIYAEVTSRIMQQMESGVIPWRKPWIASSAAVSHATGKPYSLLNQMLLGRPGEYATYAQIQKAGGYVKKGEKASMVVFWKWIEQEDEETGEVKEIPLLFDYKENSRALGLADMPKALETGREARCDYTQTRHVLEILTAFDKSSDAKAYYPMETRYTRKLAMKNNKMHGILD